MLEIFTLSPELILIFISERHANKAAEKVADKQKLLL